MKIKGDLTVCTVSELAKFLAEHIEVKDGRLTSFPHCDFCIIDEDETEVPAKDLKYIYDDACFWYGIKDIDAGFDSCCMVIMADYYTGGCAAIAQIWDDGLNLDIAEDIQSVLLDTLTTQEFADSETPLLVEFLSERTVQADRS